LNLSNKKLRIITSITLTGISLGSSYVNHKSSHTVTFEGQPLESKIEVNRGLLSTELLLTKCTEIDQELALYITNTFGRYCLGPVRSLGKRVQVGQFIHGDAHDPHDVKFELRLAASGSRYASCGPDDKIALFTVDEGWCCIEGTHDGHPFLPVSPLGVCTEDQISDMIAQAGFSHSKKQTNETKAATRKKLKEIFEERGRVVMELQAAVRKVMVKDRDDPESDDETPKGFGGFLPPTTTNEEEQALAWAMRASMASVNKNEDRFLKMITRLIEGGVDCTYAADIANAFIQLESEGICIPKEYFLQVAARATPPPPGDSWADVIQAQFALFESARASG